MRHYYVLSFAKYLFRTGVLKTQEYIRTYKRCPLHGKSRYSRMDYFYIRLDLQYEILQIKNMFKQYCWFSKRNFYKKKGYQVIGIYLQLYIALFRKKWTDTMYISYV